MNIAAHQKPLYYNSFVDILTERSRHTPDRPAFTFLAHQAQTEITWTYRQLDKRARAIAASLQQHKPAGERVLLLYPSGLDFIAAFFGCLYAQAIAIPLPIPRKHQLDIHTLTVIKNTEAKIVLTDAGTLSKIKARNDDLSAFRALTWLKTDSTDVELASQWQHPLLTLQTVAYLQYTSGSTLSPRGVRINHGNMLHNVAMMQSCFQASPERPGVIWLPHFHDMGLVGGLLQALYVGFCMILFPPARFLQSPVTWLDLISKHRGTISGGPNFAYEWCVNRISPGQCANLDLSSWEVASCGSEPIQAATLDRFAKKFEPYGFRREAFLPAYGLAEATLFVTGTPRGKGYTFLKVDKTALRENKVILNSSCTDSAVSLVSCGLPGKDQAVRIVDPVSKVMLPERSIGEVWIASDSVTDGYWQEPALTSQTIQTLPIADRLDRSEGEVSYLRTGDLGFFHERQLYITGRLKDLIIIRGKNYYPQDIETAVEQVDSALKTSGAAAFSVTIASETQLIVVQELERSALRTLDGDSIIHHMCQAIEEVTGLQPHTILLLRPGHLLKTSSGKVKRQACRDKFLNDQFKPVHRWQQPLTNLDWASPRSQSAYTAVDIQEALIHLLAQKQQLDPKDVVLEKPFADYGFSSLDAIAFVDGLDAWLKLPTKLDVTTLWDYATIPALAEYLAGLVQNTISEKLMPEPEV
ncbi:MAG: AMP-binding protein, partial [Chloroflexota bacterium]